MATLVGADALILMSDIDGLYTANPHENPNATLIRRVETIDDSILSIAGGAGSNRGHRRDDHQNPRRTDRLFQGD